MRWNYFYDFIIQLEFIFLIEGDDDSFSNEKLSINNERYYPLVMKDIIY